MIGLLIIQNKIVKSDFKKLTSRIVSFTQRPESKSHFQNTINILSYSMVKQHIFNAECQKKVKSSMKTMAMSALLARFQQLINVMFKHPEHQTPCHWTEVLSYL